MVSHEPLKYAYWLGVDHRSRTGVQKRLRRRALVNWESLAPETTLSVLVTAV